MKNPTFATRWNADLIDEQYALWQEDSSAVDEQWRAFFEGFALASEGSAGESGMRESSVDAKKQAKVSGAIYAYRDLGHTLAKLDPLSSQSRENVRLTLDRLGLADVDVKESFDTGNYLGGVSMPLGELLERLQKTYCGSIGVEYLHIQATEKRRWLQSKMEPNCNQPDFSEAKKKRILRKVIQAESFENFLQTRFVGQKRFSLEGGETAIACIDALIESCPEHGVKELVMGMAHRGRLNVLANVFNKSYEYIFNEFSENYTPKASHGSGDVKYHLGYDNIVTTTSGGSVELHLAANPSHLEAVNPVVQGRARARQRLRGDLPERKQVLPFLVHGDAAIAGQGVVAEVFNFSKLNGYQTGGTVHLVINNQIGFTTDPKDARSTMYCTAIGKMVEAPVFHVNGDDPLAVVYVTELALAYRQKFGEDVIIDMYCYRKHGHNESDEPAFTQPMLYQKIKKHPSVSKILAERLQGEGAIDQEIVKTLREGINQVLQDAYEAAKGTNGVMSNKLLYMESTAEAQPDFTFDVVKTSLPKSVLTKIAKQLMYIPDHIGANPKIRRQLDTKWKNFQEGKNIDWAFAESLAWGGLLVEGLHVRLSGQDCERGTFSHRHSTIHDVNSGEKYIPLNDIQEKQGKYCVHNSLLSEVAVLGFDYGYSLDYKRMLTMWEAQFGDFANGAQVIFDQFIASSESKWGRSSSLVMLLPHGFEGQGPEHSSARLERYLQACAENNIQVCNLSTPAQYFHMLRRQLHRSFVKPMVVMSPKSLLRHKECVSDIEEFSKGKFHEIMDDASTAKNAERLVLCSGKVYYDLLAQQGEMKDTSTALIRVEQLYPLYETLLASILRKYKKAKTLVWCQEEPENMGAWMHMMPYLMKYTPKLSLLYVGRRASASPATGALSVHVKEQKTLVKGAFQSKKTLTV